MQTDFRIIGLAPEPFAKMHAASDEDLAQRFGARRVVVDAAPGYPCRVSLRDAAIGESVVALSYTHHDVESVYRASGPIFVREGAVPPELAVNELPEMLQARPISVRGYDADGEMVAAELGEGDLAARLRQVLSDPKVAYVHLHNALPGCFDCRVERA